ncbi:MAG: hypothetical protein QXS85_06065 [Acidilobaceae archaeon]
MSVSKLAEAVVWFEEQLKALHEYSIVRANDLMRYAEENIRDLRRDIDLILKDIVEELRREAERVSQKLMEEYRAVSDKKVRELEELMNKNFDKAVEAAFEEVKRLLREV